MGLVQWLWDLGAKDIGILVPGKDGKQQRVCNGQRESLGARMKAFLGPDRKQMGFEGSSSHQHQKHQS